MLRFLLRRLAVALLVAMTVLTLSFMLTRLSGDLAISIAGPNATQEDVEIIRRAYGLDRPLLDAVPRLGRARGRGRSRQQLLLPGAGGDLIAQRMPITLTLGLVGLAIALVVAHPARHPRGGAGEHLGGPGGDAGGAGRPGDAELLARPDADDRARPARCNWLPISGTGSWQHFVMPGIVLGLLRHPGADAPDAQPA